MSSRIRYDKTEKDGILKSKRDFVSDSRGSVYHVILDINKCEYTIKNKNTRRIYKGGETINNLHVLKRKVKERLEDLGVNFSKEIRDNSSRVKGVNCGYNGKSKD